ncbi:hypothetical protein EIL87_04925 [Saccharopolyspora rhizosphaerae]|uniref:SRPBCC family protein n=1 Tax=Saccharopolyspora rhizosphaerae TaxID=2492662 RepID=A0A426K0E5_9PSEU|nr:hypothetical protein [Saccharopolyspora rhizosphaerae]RRO18860.1 hypothetical protein EIL87_04925 [Saccharopolyspora rhizosphaerae]
MPFYSTKAETDIACSAMDVYSYITNPANWDDGRPVDDPGWTLVPPGRRPAGTTWHEDRGEDWAILEAEPGRRWIVRSVDGSSSVTITYSISEVDGMTHVFRHMEIEVPEEAAIDEHARAAFACSSSGRELVTQIKHALEGARRVVLPDVPLPASTSQTS